MISDEEMARRERVLLGALEDLRGLPLKRAVVAAMKAGILPTDDHGNPPALLRYTVKHRTSCALSAPVENLCTCDPEIDFDTEQYERKPR